MKNLTKALLVSWLVLTLCAFTTPVDMTTIHGKVLTGYQGWFFAEADGSQLDAFSHTFLDETPTLPNISVDFYPYMGEYANQYDMDSSITMHGSTAKILSSYSEDTIDTHFRWMKENNIDGVFLQRFVEVFKDGNHAGKAADQLQVLKWVREAAIEYGRTWAIMYDVSGAADNANSGWWNDMLDDYKALVDDGKLDLNDNYLHEGGERVVSIWGFGFVNGVHPPESASTAIDYINWFKGGGGNTNYESYVVGGVPHCWDKLNGDSRTDSAWSNAYSKFDSILPWSVNAHDYADLASWKANKFVPQIDLADANNQDYIPVVWPGFSWYNLKKNRDGITNESYKNETPREGGDFMWKQAHNAIDALRSANANETIYIAMFDEVDEGTAIMKVAAKQDEVPDQGFWVSLDEDGDNLPHDWYLRLSGKINEMVKGDISLTSTMPIDPNDDGDQVVELLADGDTLEDGAYVQVDGAYLRMQSDGNLVFYKGTYPNSTGVIWASGSSQTGDSFVVLQGDGNLVCYAGTPASPGSAFWNTGTSTGTDDYVFGYRDEEMVICAGTARNPGTEIYDDVAKILPPPPKNQQLLAEGTTIYAGETVQLQGYYLVMQGDGNLIVREGTPNAQGDRIWKSGITSGDGDAYAVMQGDGNLVIYDVSQTPPALWSSQSSAGTGTYTFVLKDNGNVAVVEGTALNPIEDEWECTDGIGL